MNACRRCDQTMTPVLFHSHAHVSQEGFEMSREHEVQEARLGKISQWVDAWGRVDHQAATYVL